MVLFQHLGADLVGCGYIALVAPHDKAFQIEAMALDGPIAEVGDLFPRQVFVAQGKQTQWMGRGRVRQRNVLEAFHGLLSCEILL